MKTESERILWLMEHLQKRYDQLEEQYNDLARAYGELSMEKAKGE